MTEATAEEKRELTQEEKEAHQLFPSVDAWEPIPGHLTFEELKGLQRSGILELVGKLRTGRRLLG